MNLEKNLVLNKYFLNLFGFNDFNELREKLKDTEEGYDSRGRTYFVDVLIGLKPEWESLLLRYDEAIKEYTERLRKNRGQPDFNLKYFQYLAVLFTEMFLDRYYNDRQSFLNDLNEFLLKRFNSENGSSITSFTEEEFRKLAFWMATGSGKTLIMHINYWQILKYSKNSWDNIILITPNENLSKQHYEELKLSGIPCKLYDGNIDNIKTKSGEVLIINIHKLTEEKKGEGASVDISYFDGRNLVFIDEGHKGQRSEEQKWKKLREEIGKRGFLFEYSATFGQVIGNNEDLLEEYAKAIIFDYSYKYFYADGYGKDFYIYNIQTQKKGNKEIYSEEQQNLLLIAGLLSFYEQLLIFEKHREELKKYNVEKPLWVFVGSKVTGAGLNSDVISVVKFLDKITEDEKYFKESVDKVLSGKSDLVDNEGNDVFNNKFEFIRKFHVEKIVEDIYRMVFGRKGKLELYEIRNAQGEIGLKTTTGEKYFGVIDIGDASSLKMLIRESGIEVKDDYLSQSLFFGINENDSHINILIGSKKFIEGWNSWRVSSMGLINMGKGEGPQIIQLFGRGVRLKGKSYSLKREENPDYKLKMLQTLFIFGLNADYINAFLATIEKEEVDYEEIVIPIKLNMPEKWEGKLYTIKTRDNFDFLEHTIDLEVDVSLLKDIKLDLRPKITITHGFKMGAVSTATDEPLEIPDEYLKIIDWDSVCSEIINYKTVKGMYNLLINRNILKEIVYSRKYQIFMSDVAGVKIEEKSGKNVLKITTFEGLHKFHEIILMVLKDYMTKFYRKIEKQKAMDYLEVKPLIVNEYSSMFPENNKIILKIPRKFATDLVDVTTQLKEYNSGKNKIPELWRGWNSFIIHFDNHLYTPLIIWKQRKEEIKSIPVKLNKGETKFINDLRRFLNGKKDSFQNKELFLLRNLARKGIGFFLSTGFYPDFILWVKSENKQYMIFIDPKGIRNLGNFDDEKIQLCTSFIKEIETKANEELRNRREAFNLQLDAFIISVSRYDDIKGTFGNRNHSRDEFESHNIMFQEDEEYITKIFNKIGIISND